MQEAICHTLNETLKRRYSTRAFSDRRVDASTLRSIFEAARQSPSSFNDQPWRFIVATRDQPEEYERMLACLVEQNRVWAGQAPVLMISVANHTFSKNGKPNRHAFHDVGLATMSMMVQATHLGLYMHAMAGFDPELARSTFGLPEGCEAVAAIALGYQADLSLLPEDVRKKEDTRTPRRPLSETVFEGAWGRHVPWAE